jgi:hypothetical protein
MTSKKEIKDTILNTAGNPESGVIKDFADELAEAIAKLISGEAPIVANNNSQSGQAKETRVVGVAEKR